MRGAAAFAVAACGLSGAASIAAWPVAGIAPAAAVISAVARVVPAGPVRIAVKKHWLAVPAEIAEPPAPFVRFGGRRTGWQLLEPSADFSERDFETEPEGILVRACAFARGR